MKNLILFFTVLSIFVSSCGSTKTAPPIVQRVPAKFDFSPPSRSQVGSANIIIAMVKPTYVGANPEYFVNPFNEMAMRMSTDFDELLTAKGVSIRGPYGSRDEMTYNDKMSSSFILEIGIELNPQYNRKSNSKYNSPSFAAILLTDASGSYTYSITGEITLAGNLVIKAKSAQFGELLWTKSIALESSSFNYTGQEVWGSVPSMAEELNKDNLVYNKVSIELEKIYMKALNLAWQQIDVEEMKTIAVQAKKADKRGAN